MSEGSQAAPPLGVGAARAAQQAQPWPWLILFAIYGGFTALYLWPVLRSFATVIPHDPGDPALNTWIVWWNAQAVPLTERWWNAPIFHPMTNAFALSETLLGIAPLTTPMQWLGASPIVAANTAYVLSYPAAAFAAHALARRLTGRHDAAVLAGLAFAFSPYRGAQATHLQMLWSCWTPLCLFALHRYLDRHQRRDLVLAGACWILNGLTSGYLLMYFAVLAGFWLLWFARTRRDWIAIVGTFGVASALLSPVLIGYQLKQAALGLRRDAGEIGGFSADLTSIWATAADVWLPNHWTIQPRPEGELYPGIFLLALVGTAVAIAWRQARTRRLSVAQRTLLAAGFGVAAIVAMAVVSGGWQFELFGTPVSMTRPAKPLFLAACLIAVAIAIDRRVADTWRRRSLLGFYAAGAVVMFLFALGPIGRVNGQTFFYGAPYAWLMQLPGGHALRVPARFATFMTLCLAQAGALAFARLVIGDRRVIVAAGLAALIALDGYIPRFPTSPVPTLVQLGQAPADMPLLEIPARDLFAHTTAMLRATGHGHPLINGFSGYEPAFFGPIQDGLRYGDPTVFAALQQFGPFLVLVKRGDDEEGTHEEYVRSAPGAKLLGRTAIGPLFQFPGAPAASTTGTSAAPATTGTGTAASAAITTATAEDAQIAITHVAATSHQDLASAAVDGSLATAWSTGGRQDPGVEVRLTLDRPVIVTRVRLDLGVFTHEFPRELRIDVSDGRGGAATTVWTGGTAGLAITGAYRDRVRAPITIDVMPGAPAQMITLTSLGSDREYPWSIAEVAAFGRTP